MPRERTVSLPREHFGRIDLLLCLILAVLVAFSRVAERGALYFVDGPRLVLAIRNGTYIIQSPGYWAFAHLGGLFQNPAAGLAFWNILFSAVGVPVFYGLCRERQANRAVCFAAALAYGFTYFAWFAGEIHSSYASQMLFPALALLCALRWRRTHSLFWLTAWSLSAGVGFALRPSDGVFLFPLWLFLLIGSGKAARSWMLFFGLQIACFLCWYLPTRQALLRAGLPGSGALILVSMRTVSPLFLGFSGRSLANMARVVVPSAMAFGALIPALWSRRSAEDQKIALFWLLPGLSFFLLCYVADPTYMLCLYGAWFWLTVTNPNSRRALVCLSLCAVFNAALFLEARPIRNNGSAAKLANFYLVKYCRYGLEHQWSSTVGSGGPVP